MAFVSGLFHLAQYFPDSSIWSMYFILFMALKPHYIYPTVYSSGIEHLDCFQFFNSHK
jgi:hypothetical protein